MVANSLVCLMNESIFLSEIALGFGSFAPKKTKLRIWSLLVPLKSLKLFVSPTVTAFR
jgi:hypothetical protein